MLIGYARTSTFEQQYGFDTQIERLAALGCEKIFSEKVSSFGKRSCFADAMAYVREGDCLLVTKLDRLARSVTDLWSIVRQLDEKGVSLRILDLSIDTSDATGKLMLSMLAAVAQFEREIMLERQRDGIAKARAAGKRFGRKPTAHKLKPDIQRLKNDGKGATEIARLLNISRASVYRCRDEAAA